MFVLTKEHAGDYGGIFKFVYFIPRAHTSQHALKIKIPQIFIEMMEAIQYLFILYMSVQTLCYAALYTFTKLCRGVI